MAVIILTNSKCRTMLGSTAAGADAPGAAGARHAWRARRGRGVAKNFLHLWIRPYNNANMPGRKFNLSIDLLVLLWYFFINSTIRSYSL